MDPKLASPCVHGEARRAGFGCGVMAKPSSMACLVLAVPQLDWRKREVCRFEPFNCQDCLKSLRMVDCQRAKATPHKVSNTVHERCAHCSRRTDSSGQDRASDPKTNDGRWQQGAEACAIWAPAHQGTISRESPSYQSAAQNFLPASPSHLHHVRTLARSKIFSPAILPTQ